MKILQILSYKSGLLQPVVLELHDLKAMLPPGDRIGGFQPPDDTNWLK